MPRYLFALLFFVCLGAMAAEPVKPAPAPETAPTSIDGEWIEGGRRPDAVMPGINGETFTIPGGRIPGSYTIIQLHTEGSKVTGSGTYSMEAGPRGTLAISGQYLAPDVTLTITRNNGQVATYKGKRVSATRLDGSLRYEGYEASDTSFVRE